jgi:hypothetical protein
MRRVKLKIEINDRKPMLRIGFSCDFDRTKQIYNAHPSLVCEAFYTQKTFTPEKLTQKILYLIVSNDSIMKPPYDITPTILQLVSLISEKIGEVNATYLNKQSPQLRKQNKIKTIHSS